MADPSVAIRRTLNWEGGYSNNPNDPGGPTMYGITQSEARNHGYTGPMEELPLRFAIQIYEAKYWQEIFGQLTSQRAANKLFDMRVNTGLGNGIRLFQEAINAVLPDEEDIEIDSSFGPATLAAANSIPEEQLLPALVCEHEDYYWQITRRCIMKRAIVEFDWTVEESDNALKMLQARNLQALAALKLQLKAQNKKIGYLDFLVDINVNRSPDYRGGWLDRAVSV